MHRGRAMSRSQRTAQALEVEGGHGSASDTGGRRRETHEETAPLSGSLSARNSTRAPRHATPRSLPDSGAQPACLPACAAPLPTELLFPSSASAPSPSPSRFREPPKFESPASRALARTPPMPSKRPSPHAMDEAAASAAAARLRPSTPRSKKRTSRSKSRGRSSRDRRRSSPNPNPSSRRERAAAADHGSAGAAPSRKSDRKPKPRSFPDSATLATAMASVAAAASASAAAAAAPSAGGGGRGSAGAVQKLWTEADEVALLTGAVAFKDRTGIAPRLPDMGELFESIKDSLAPHLDQAKVYYKLKRLKSKFQHSVPGESSTAHEHRLRDLGAALWGAELARPEENAIAVAEEADEDDADEGIVGGDREGAVKLPMVKEVLGEYWRLNGQTMSGVSLEKGLAMLGPQEASVAEVKWRRQLEADMRMQMRRHDLEKEVYGLLIDAIKGLGP
ncbi:STOREKEEPER protein [Sorghum bicolor]|nr:STOREKEEPER protein [Sorghum bicolor]|eukprot:XP_002436676.2 STOREKEEPER protein [Sorghum bicolor]